MENNKFYFCKIKRETYSFLHFKSKETQQRLRQTYTIHNTESALKNVLVYLCRTFPPPSFSFCASSFWTPFCVFSSSFLLFQFLQKTHPNHRNSCHLIQSAFSSF